MIQNNAIDSVEVKKHYYKSGALERETPYVNGKVHGLAKWYYESGALWSEAPYVNGERHGIEKTYYASGALWWEIPYVDGNKHGIEKKHEADKSSIVSLTLYNKGHKVDSVKFSKKEIAHDPE